MTTGSEEKPKYVSSSTKQASIMHSGIGGGNYRDMAFVVAVIMSQVMGLIIIGLVIHWCFLYKGFSWADPNLQFNYHPLFMVLGLIYFYGDAIIIYRVLHFLPKWILKITHASLHICAILFATIALVAVLENHRRTYKADFYSLHSWMGIGTFSLFILQYIASFVTYLLPWTPNIWRARFMPFHVFFGLGLFTMAVGTAEMGLTEKLLWTGNYTSNQMVTEGVIGNTIGLFLVVFAFLIIFITTRASYKRHPLPSEILVSPTN
ncbi:cytochrome b561 [Nephila pilipes]|uniref:Cytochrome b561 n=1 Tax=Nephila pilipes TaxID=299642 RepID=A0A8X6TKT2_NEPPI|nr:cytochrome b561 [Nephila pilipes]